MSIKQRNHTISAAIQIKNQKLHRMTFQKLPVSIATPPIVSAGTRTLRFAHETVRAGGASAEALMQTLRSA
jgi:hypothetical protein